MSVECGTREQNKKCSTKVYCCDKEYHSDSDYDGCSARPLLGHHALVRVVGFRVAGFMLSGSGIRACVLGNVELGWGGCGKVQFNVGG